MPKPLTPIQKFELDCMRYVVDPTTLKREPIFNHDRAGEASGVYFLWGDDDALLYIGSSRHIITRLAQHWWARKIPFLAFSILEVDDYGDGFYWGDHVEGVYIRALSPPFNSRPRMNNFRGDDKMQAAVIAAWAAYEFVPA